MNKSNYMSKVYTDFLLPRVVYVPYFFTKFFLFVFSFFRISKSNKCSNSSLCIEAGVKGWESIEFKEFFESANEYLGGDKVDRLEIRPNEDYLDQVFVYLKEKKPTHYLYDPRTGAGGTLDKLWRSFRMAIILHRNAVVPIVILTDLSVRVSRAQSAIVSARNGLVVCFMSTREAGSIFPHDRLIGPSLMPFSAKTMKYLDEISGLKPNLVTAKALFVGAMYEPRKTILEEISLKLTQRGYLFEIKGRVVGQARLNDSEYWEQLCYADIIVTTADQGYHYKNQQGEMIQRGADRIDIPQLVYRYLEVLASGSLLVAPAVPGVCRYFTPWVHFIPFNSTEEAINVIAHYLDHESERLMIAKSGKERAQALISARCFWLLVDTALRDDSML